MIERDGRIMMQQISGGARNVRQIKSAGWLKPEAHIHRGQRADDQTGRVINERSSGRLRSTGRERSRGSTDDQKQLQLVNG